ncbi:MAG: hypothetical protein ACO3JL_09285 [Myxococcota bacterium]
MRSATFFLLACATCPAHATPGETSPTDIVLVAPEDAAGSPPSAGAEVAAASLSSTQPSAAAAAAPVVGEAAKTTGPAATAAASSCPEDKPCLDDAGFALWPSVRLRGLYEYIQPDPNVLFVGHNDGFLLDQARLGVNVGYKGRFLVRLVADLSTLLPGGLHNEPAQPLVAAARDAYVAWTPSPWFFVAVGQQFMPLVYEGQVTRGELNFTSRSIVGDGVRAGRGFETPGLAPGRQVGVVLGARRAPVGPVTLDYRLGLTNGNAQNLFGNDNKLPAIIGRVGADYGGLFGIGLAGQYNPRTEGELPNLFTETHSEAAADVRADVFGVELLLQGIYRHISFDDVFLNAADPNASDTSLGVVSWIVLDHPFGLPTFGCKPAYRFSYYDPSASDVDDALMEHTVAVRYDPPTALPLAFFVEGTLLLEQGEFSGAAGRALENNRLVAMLQFDL